MRRTAVVLSGIGFLAGALAATAAGQSIENSTVRIVNYSQRPSWYSPWVAPLATQSFGSGFVIEGGLILTNAHVVSDARLVQVYLRGDPNPHEAKVRFIGHDCDLALLEPVSPDLLSSVRPLPFGTLPSLGTEVETYGYPIGNPQISSTRGVVSRIAVTLYTHSGADQHIAAQTDAAINPGNSGGPVVQRGRLVGVAFQAAPDLENVGFFIPMEVVRHFLEDVSDGHYDGYPELGTLVTSLENPAARSRLGLAAGESGVRVTYVSPGSSADGRLEVGDVLLEIDGHRIANDRSIAWNGLRLHLGVQLDSHQVGSEVRFRVLRAGERLDVVVPMLPYPTRERFANVYDRLPRYYVYAGLVFLPLDREMLKTFGDDWRQSADVHLRNEYFLRFLAEPERMQVEPVVLSRRLDHQVNADQAWHQNLVVDRVNGREIDSLEDLVGAIEGNDGRYHVIEFAYYDRVIVLDRAASDRAHPEILEIYGVHEDRRL